MVGGSYGAIDIPAFSVRAGTVEPASVVSRYCKDSNCCDDKGNSYGCAIHADTRNGPGFAEAFCFSRHDVVHVAESTWQVVKLADIPWPKHRVTLRDLGSRNLSCVFGKFSGGDLELHGHRVLVQFPQDVTRLVEPYGMAGYTKINLPISVRYISWASSIGIGDQHPPSTEGSWMLSSRSPLAPCISTRQLLPYTRCHLASNATSRNPSQ